MSLPEIEWFANLENPRTRRPYQSNLKDFVRFLLSPARMSSLSAKTRKFHPSLFVEKTRAGAGAVLMSPLG
jgi:hypothetical protein